MPLLFFELFGHFGENPPLTITILLTLAVLLVNGWTDAPNAIAGVVATGTLSFQKAVLLAACCNVFGILCVTAVNTSVTETIYSIASFGGGPTAALTALCAAMTAIVVWATAAWAFGIPTSESHALVAGISGAAVALEGNLSCLRLDCWGRVLLGLLLSSLAGFFLGRWMQHTLSTVKLNSRTVSIGQVLSAAAAAFLHGAQDGQKFLGVFLLGSALAQGRVLDQTIPVPFWLVGLCAFVMALGTLMGGRRIIDKIGRDMVTIGPQEGLAADLGSILCLAAATLLGLPVSTTHTRTSALLGVGMASGGSVDSQVARQLLLAWLFTFPGCMAIGYWTAKCFFTLLL